MEQFIDENNRKDDFRDRENDNEEASTSNSEFNDPTLKAYNINDLKTLDFNSADAVRQAMKALYKDTQWLHCKIDGIGSSTEITDVKTLEDTDHQYEQKGFNNVILNSKCKEDQNKEAATLDTEVNNPSQEALNMNDLKYIGLISSDDMRLKNTNFIQNQDSPEYEDSERLTLTEKVDTEFCVKVDRPHNQLHGDGVILNVGKVNDTRDKQLNHDTRQTRKRRGRPPKPGPSKKCKNSKFKEIPGIFYCGKLSNLIFKKNKKNMKRKYRHEPSSDDNSIFSF